MLKIIAKLKILRSMLRISMVFAVLCIVTIHSQANNISVSNVSLPTQVAASNYTMVEFDVSWDNSWRTSTFESNWDAAWIFVKYRLLDQSVWSHATLDTVGMVAPAGTNLDVSSDGMGAFIYRDANGTGSVNFTDAQVRWKYAVDGLDDDDSVEICVMAIEMVYVPEGSFYLGSGGSSTGEFYEYPNTNQEYLVTSEAAITVDSSAGNLYYPAGSYSGDRSGPIPAAFPKGYAAFYCMKYEITQEQYVAFLNKLTYQQQEARTVVPPDSTSGILALASGTQNRNGIVIQTPGVPSSVPAVYGNDLDGDLNFNEADDGQNIACNYLRWNYFKAYLDWTGLRPMTELEYEKACRGTAPPLVDEYAWGGNTVILSAYTLNNEGAANEGIATNYAALDGNAMYTTSEGAIDGPLRVGVFAANAGNTGRTTSGATYWGIMEMTGNVSETCITTGEAGGRLFTGEHGDGELTTAGASNVSGWGTSWSYGYHGGYWNGSAWQVSWRGHSRVHDSGFSAPINAQGGRGVRTAP